MENKKKILFAVTHGGWGGAQRYVFDLATNIDPVRFDIEVAAGGANSGELLTRLTGAGIKTHFLRHLKRGLSPITNGLLLFELIGLIKKSSPDIIHLNSTNAGIIGSLAAGIHKLSSVISHRSSVKVIFTAHGFRFNEPGLVKRAAFIALEKFASRFRNRIICVSEADRASALRYRIAPPSKLTTIWNAVANFKPLPRAEARKKLFPKAEPDELIIGAIAQHYPAKGLRYLVDAANLISKGGFPAKFSFAIVGNGPEYKNLESRIKNYGLRTRFSLLPYQENGSRYLTAFDIIVSPSVKEGLPYALIEASLASRAIIATRVGGVPEIIRHNETGILIPPGDPLALAQAIQALAGSKETRAALGEEARRFTEQRFHFDEMLKQTQKIYFMA